MRQAPPTFLLFVNRDELFSDAYKKYLAGKMREAFGYEGCPIILVPKARPKTIEPVRKFQPVYRREAHCSLYRFITALHDRAKWQKEAIADVMTGLRHVNSFGAAVSL